MVTGTNDDSRASTGQPDHLGSDGATEHTWKGTTGSVLYWLHSPSVPKNGSLAVANALIMISFLPGVSPCYLLYWLLVHPFKKRRTWPARSLVSLGTELD